MTEETINFRIEYDVRGLDQSIRGMQHQLYFLNATRLAIVDIQRVMSGPTIHNVMWTAVQLTRVWTHLYRLIKKTNEAQKVGIAQTLGSTAARRVASGQSILQFGAGGTLGVGTTTGFLASMMALAVANPVIAGAIITGLTVSALGYRQYFVDRKMRIEREEFIQRQRIIARTQGLEY